MRYARHLKMAHEAGLQELQAELAQRHGELIAGVIKAVVLGGSSGRAAVLETTLRSQRSRRSYRTFWVSN